MNPGHQPREQMHLSIYFNTLEETNYPKPRVSFFWSLLSHRELYTAPISWLGRKSVIETEALLIYYSGMIIPWLNSVLQKCSCQLISTYEKNKLKSKMKGHDTTKDLKWFKCTLHRYSIYQFQTHLPSRSWKNMLVFLIPVTLNDFPSVRLRKETNRYYNTLHHVYFT